jgi:hypothetical protein
MLIFVIGEIFSREKNLQKGTFLTTFSLKAFTGRTEQAIICPIWTKTFEKKSKKTSKFLIFFAILSIFEAMARLSALKSFS